jgi:diaminopimelate decarboxylase
MELKNDRYLIDGTDVLSLIEKYGSPLYVYNTGRMKAQYDRLVKAFSGIDLKVNYACKALTNLSILRFFRSMGTGLDAVSIQEVQLGLRAGFKP